jgi:hypothetical protein
MSNFIGQEIMPMDLKKVELSLQKTTVIDDTKMGDASVACEFVARNIQSDIVAVKPSPSSGMFIHNEKATLSMKHSLSFDIDTDIGLFISSNNNGLSFDSDRVCGGLNLTKYLGRHQDNEIESVTNRSVCAYGLLTDNNDTVSIQYDRYGAAHCDIDGSNVKGKRVFYGVKIDPIVSQSYASDHYVLTVIATHSYKSIVNINAKTRGRMDFRGKYQLIINGSIALGYASDVSDLTEINIDISPGQLAKGNNACWLNILHSDGYLEYLDFEVFKEDSNRTSVERLFRDYDGGFDGKFWCPPKILNFESFPCATIPEYGDNLLITTTDSTSINLKNILTIQNLVAIGKNFKLLVSFDGRQTWQAFSGNAWATVDLSTISTTGMPIATVNSITEAQWSDVFTKKELNLAIYIDNNLNSSVLWGSGVAGDSAQSNWYNVPYDTKITSIYTNSNQWDGYWAYVTIYSLKYPNGFRIPTNGTYSILPDDRVYSIGTYLSPRQNSYHPRYEIYARNCIDANIKSIKVNMTVNPFKGYAFII